MTAVNTTDIKKDRPQLIKAGTRFDWLALITLLWLFIGTGLDGMAHFHMWVDSKEGFFTSFHAVLYSGGLAAIAVYYGTVVVNRLRGYTFWESIPEGYDFSIIGSGVFALAGLGDLVWHTLFGIESSLEISLSPTHLLLALGLLMIMSGPLRSMLKRYSGSAAVLGWKDAFPGIISLSMLVTVASTVLSFLSPFVAAWSSNRYSIIPTVTLPPGIAYKLHEFAVALGIAGLIFTGAFFVGIVFLINSRIKLPFGAWTIILSLTTLMVVIFYDEYRFLAVALIGGVIIDVLVYRYVEAGQWKPIYYRLAFVIPILLFSVYFAVLALTGGFWWNTHVWVGSLGLSGVAGFAVCYLLRPHYRQTS